MKIPKLINIAGHNIKIVRKKTLKSDGIPYINIYMTIV
jgi:hypothetical protein